MKLGFTGTRHGMTAVQRTALLSLLHKLHPTEAHHGDCIGADAQFADIVNNMLATTQVVVHPPILNRARGGTIRPGNVVMEARGYLSRDVDIVDAVKALIGAPNSMQEAHFGGTWFTIRYARTVGKEHYIVWPDGTITHVEAKWGAE